jgi:hypothetical protein
MQAPAIQAALDNLVETIRTSLMAEFLELLRDGRPAKIKSSRVKKKKASKASRPRKTKTAG